MDSAFGETCAAFSIRLHQNLQDLWKKGVLYTEIQKDILWVISKVLLEAFSLR
jgi:hypothetical protein